MPFLRDDDDANRLGAGPAELSGRPGSPLLRPARFPLERRRFFDAVRPRLMVLMETGAVAEHDRGGEPSANVPALLVNARLSERSARGYARIGFAGALDAFPVAFCCLSVPGARRAVHRDRADVNRMRALGSVKFDMTLPADHVRACGGSLSRWRPRAAPVWIAGSTHPGEEEIVPWRRTGLIRAPIRTRAWILCRDTRSRCDDVAALAGEPASTVVRQSGGDVRRAIPA